jgi:transposase
MATVCKNSCRSSAEVVDVHHPVEIRYAPIRVSCPRCSARPVEMVAWAEPYQRQTRRLQQRLAVEAASMPVMHVAALHGLSWLTVRRSEERAIERWEATRPLVPLRWVGVDEKWLGRRHAFDYKFVTIVSNLETGEPVWIGKGRSEETLKRWLQSLSKEQKAGIQLFAMDMLRAYWNAVDNTRGLEHAPIVHDPFHVLKLAGQMLDELRREVFFRAGPEMRALGRGKRWLLLRAWERTSDAEKDDLRKLLAHNRTLARAYQIKEELRDVLHAPDRLSMEVGLKRILRRTARRDIPALRRLHDTLHERWNEIVALAEHRPPVGRIEALNNNWETLVRRARGYRDHNYLLRKLRFMTANPIRTGDGIRRFLALGLTPPMPNRHAA